MKNKAISTLLLGMLFQLFFSACDRSPQVFSVNNFRSGFEVNGKVSLVLPKSVKGVTGIWVGMEHQLRFSPAISSGPRNTPKKTLKDTSFFIVELIDTIPEASGYRDTTAYDLSFITIAGLSYIEIISPGTKIAAHDFMLPVSSYIKLNKLTKDTMIIQMPEGRFAESFLQSNGFNYFVPFDNLKEDIRPVYITENPERLAQILKSLHAIPEAFQQPDTLLKKY
jgi:hypothetical protein